MSGTTASDPSPAAAETANRLHWPVALRTGCRYALAIVFLLAAAAKFTDLPGFTDHVILHSGLPPGPARFAAALAPSLEMVCGVCLFFGVAVREAAGILALLLGLFLAYQGVRPAEADCGCLLFPEAFRPIQNWPWPLARNAALLVAAAVVTREGRPKRIKPQSPEGCGL